MRADALRNREQLIEAAIALILECGGEPSRDALAAHAGVGIGTVYRHFPDQRSLLEAVVRHALERSIAAGEAALADTSDGFEALRKYLHTALDSGLGVVNLVYPILGKSHPDLRARAESMLHAMVERAKRERSLRRDASLADIVFASIRFCRPLAVGLSPSAERALAHRQIDIYFDGLRRVEARSPVRARPSGKGVRR